MRPRRRRCWRSRTTSHRARTRRASGSASVAAAIRPRRRAQPWRGGGGRSGTRRERAAWKPGITYADESTAAGACVASCQRPKSNSCARDAQAHTLALRFAPSTLRCAQRPALPRAWRAAAAPRRCWCHSRARRAAPQATPLATPLSSASAPTCASARSSPRQTTWQLPLSCRRRAKTSGACTRAQSACVCACICALRLRHR
jgi:hypothetical protein